MGIAIRAVLFGCSVSCCVVPHRCFGDEALGEALFRHNWARPDEWSQPEPLGHAGDGLGPVFNAVSCLACHSMGGAGGSGGNNHNVEFLSVVFPRGVQSRRQLRLVQQAQELHPQITPQQRSVMLHQHGFGADDDVIDYDLWRHTVRLAVDQGLPSLVAAGSPATGDHVPLRISQRSTPALWGAGLVERLRRAGGDRLRTKIAIAQHGANRGITGRVPRTADGRPGWFGWRGQVDHLGEFVQSACANELGLSVSNHPQPTSPRSDASKRISSALDLTDSQVVALTRYCASLPRPEQVFPLDADEQSTAYAGERVFEKIGCVDCHVPRFGPVKYVYSDFLLHDMGDSLADPVSAFPEQPLPRRSRQGGNYSGGSAPPASLAAAPQKRTRLTHEWRTPPLWGVADSPPYLHDGRAPTLEEAIRQHNGEGQRAADAYRELAPVERSQLLAFLGTLRAPQTALALSSEPQDSSWGN